MSLVTKTYRLAHLFLMNQPKKDEKRHLYFKNKAEMILKPPPFLKYTLII